ncbi:MAG: hypothetical protein EBT21_08445, partial [Actinobacteria bacterium]|nr:hypothetical protein [Actinomycetota bacterium]
ARRRERDQGVMSLFGDVGGDDTVFSEKREIPALQFDKSEQLKFEKEMLGLYVSDHPLMGIEGALRRRVDASIAEAVEREDNSFFTIGGIISTLNRKYTRKGDLMATFMLEDLQGAVEVAVFPKTFQRYGHQLADDVIVTVKGRLNKQDETRVSFMATDIVVQEGLRASGDSLHIKVSAQALTPELIGFVSGVRAPGWRQGDATRLQVHRRLGPRDWTDSRDVRRGRLHRIAGEPELARLKSGFCWQNRGL